MSEQPALARAEEDGKLAMECTAELVDQLGQGISHFAAIASLQAR